MPQQIEEAMICPNILKLVNDRFLFCCSQTHLLRYDLKKLKTDTLFGIYKDLDGYDGPWSSDDGLLLVFSFINQERKYDYKESVRLVVLHLNDTTLKIEKKQKYDRPVNFSCGSTCFIESNNIVIKDKKTIQYLRNINIEMKPGKWDTIQLE